MRRILRISFNFQLTYRHQKLPFLIKTTRNNSHVKNKRANTKDIHSKSSLDISTISRKSASSCAVVCNSFAIFRYYTTVVVASSSSSYGIYICSPRWHPYSYFKGKRRMPRVHRAKSLDDDLRRAI